MPQFMDKPVRSKAKAWGLAILVSLLVVIIAIVVHVSRTENMSQRSGYSVGYQIGPHYPADSGSSWAGTPYALTPMRDGEKPCRAPARPSVDKFTPFAPPDEGPRGTDDPPSLVYTPPFTNDLRGDHPNWWRPDGGSHGLPPAAERPDFWAGDATLHTYHARGAIPQLCDADAVASERRRPSKSSQVARWQYYGGPKGWNMSPYY